MHDRFVISNDIQSLLLARFDDALKASRRILFFAIDAFFMIVYCFAFVEKMLVRAEITSDVVTTNFVDVIVLLTTKALFEFALFFKVFACSMRVVIQQVVFDQTIHHFRVDEFDDKKCVFFFRFLRLFDSRDFYNVHVFV